MRGALIDKVVDVNERELMKWRGTEDSLTELEEREAWPNTSIDWVPLIDPLVQTKLFTVTLL